MIIKELSFHEKKKRIIGPSFKLEVTFFGNKVLHKIENHL